MFWPFAENNSYFDCWDWDTTRWGYDITLTTFQWLCNREDGLPVGTDGQ